MGIEKRLIEDANLTRGMQLATPERITKVIRDVLKGEVGVRVKVYEQTCMRCGACANACHEGAIAMVNGKAHLMRDDYCDGFGDCLPHGLPLQPFPPGRRVLYARRQARQDHLQDGPREREAQRRTDAGHRADRAHRMQHVPPLHPLLSRGRGHRLPDEPRAAHLQQARHHPDLHSGHRQQPFRHVQPDVGARRRMDRQPRLAGRGSPRGIPRHPHPARQGRRRLHVLGHRARAEVPHAAHLSGRRDLPCACSRATTK